MSELFDRLDEDHSDRRTSAGSPLLELVEANGCPSADARSGSDDRDHVVPGGPGSNETEVAR